MGRHRHVELRCKLSVVEEGRSESFRGAQGSYLPPEWTSGSLETIDISYEGELYAKLPLGSASLGGRVSGGENTSPHKGRWMPKRSIPS
ncbi:MAG: hypothetical protein ACRBN8_07650 [Nannocystales bacterium]